LFIKHRSAQVLRNSRSHLKAVGFRTVTSIIFKILRTQKILGVIVKYSVAMAN